MKSETTNGLKDNICKTCMYCRYIRTPEITGNPIDFVCALRGTVIADVNHKECDDMYKKQWKVKKSKTNEAD
jgi:hypothetical protein